MATSTDEKFRALRSHGYQGATNDMWARFLNDNNGGADVDATTDALDKFLTHQGFPTGRVGDRMHAFLSTLYPALADQALNDLTSHWYADGMPVA